MSQCVQMRLSSLVYDTNGQNETLFQQNERFAWEGMTFQFTEPCACGSGGIAKTFYQIELNGHTYNVNVEFAEIVECFDQVVTLDPGDRAMEIAEPKQYDGPNADFSDCDAPENRDDAGRLKQFNQMAVFDLRRNKG